jgi:hypothetical protein
MATDVRIYESAALGVRFEIDAAFALIAPDGSSGDGCEPPACAAHFIAARPEAGWIAALAVATVTTDQPPVAADWRRDQLSRARESFAEWPAQAADLTVPPEATRLAGRPALHVSYRLRPAERADGPGPQAGGERAAAEAADVGEAGVPPSHVEHWTVLVAERSRLLVLELMVQPPQRWDEQRATLERPFHTLQLL